MQTLRIFLRVAFLFLGACSEGKKVSVKEVVFDSAVSDIQWLGTDQKTVLVQTTKGRLYRSVNGGDAWKDISDQLKGRDGTQVVVDHLVKSPAETSTMMVAGTKHDHYITDDGGATFRRIRQKASIHTFLFHKTRPKWALMSAWTDACEAKKNAIKKSGDDDADIGPCSHMLYLTKDLGKTFTLVTSYVVQFSWGEVSQQQQDRLYFTHFRNKKGDQPKLYMWSEHVDFAYSDDYGKNINRLVTNGNKFLISNGFVFVAKLKETKSQTVNLMCSNDGGKNFRQVQLPQDLDEKSYTVLDTSEGAVMIHVHHASTEAPYNVGNVYISDAQGVRYTLSLPNNVRSSHGECEFDKVLSLEGVYMANFKDVPRADGDGKKEGISSKKADALKDAEDLEAQASSGTEVDKRRTPKAKAKDESIVRTVISFDKGGVWSYLKPPTVDSRGAKIDCPPDRCWLHLHGITNFQNYAPFYSTENAVGIIMGTGNVGPYLRFEPDQTNTFLSRDGGLTWSESHKGAFIYEFGDHGGLVVMADDVRKTKQVVFSWNEGQSWYDFELSDIPLEVDNIVTEPSATSTKFLLYGTRGDTGVMYHLDFEALGQSLCKGVWAADSVSSDYETWMPSDGKGTEKCMLGRQVSYTRRKQTSECFNGEKFERPTSRKNCACTEENFECEMGFTRKVGSVECKFADDGSIPVPDQCTSSDYFNVVGHRKVIGDSCEGGWQPQKVAVPCPANSRMSRGAMSVLGTISVVAAIMGAVTFLSRSEKFKGVFANYGFDAYGDVKYATIGARTPETGLDSCGTRFDADFIDNDQDDFDDDAPQLMAYTGGGGDDRDRDRDRDRSRRDVPRGVDTASAAVPRLSKPPGKSSAASDGDELDLL
mmetsp:Transcript_17253/g.60261  ORF Transcript_17253/g.60261 Transcript_17253/m.60261 type:complete len:875 (-) Transcript_17253:107-2731(-)